MKRLLLFILLTGVAVGGYIYYIESSKQQNGIVDTSFTEIKQRGVLKVATKFGAYPWAAYDPSTGEAAGGEPEIAKTLAGELGARAYFIESGDPIKTVRDGDADMALYRYHRVDDKEISMSDGYFANGLALVVRVDSPIKTLSDLEGNKTAYSSASCCPDAEKLIKDNAGLPVPYQGETAITSALRDLEGKAVDAAMLEMTETAWYVRFHPLLKLVDGDENHFVQSGLSYRAAVRSGDSALLTEINRGIGRMKTKQSYKDIISKWYLFKI